MVAAFKKRKATRPASKLDSSTLRGFGGGWNSIDDDLSMKPSYQVTLVNFHRTSSGTQQVRYGTKFNFDISSIRNSPIVDGFYFNGANIVVTESGNILRADLAGTTIIEIWNAQLAALLPGAPGPWRPGIKHVSFVPFKDTLIIHTGQDKPVTISSTWNVTYLQDLATGSNANVPIGNFGCVAANYHCIAGINTVDASGVITARSPTEISISSKGSAGTFQLDPAPNDATSIDVGAYAPEGAAAIRGIAGFRTYLLVFLQNITLQIKLGEYDDSTPPKHTPQFPDTLPQFGILGNRTICTVENDIMFGGLSGLASAKRNLYAPDSITSDYLSTTISTAYRKIVGALTDDDQQNKAFAAYDKLNNNYLLFLPNGKVLCYTFNPRLKMNAWSSFENMDWTSAWTSILGRLFMSKGTKVFSGGNGTFSGENYYVDRLLDRDLVYSPTLTGTTIVGSLWYDGVADETWECIKSYTKTAGLTFAQERANHPDAWEQYVGNNIMIEMELPWIDGKDPMKLKQLRYISIATKGDAEFKFEVYVDNLYKDVNGDKLRDKDGNEIDPSAEMIFIGNDAWGYGYDDGQYGMGRRSRDPRLYALPVKFKSIKFRITGSVSKKLELVNLSFLYARNKIHGYIR